MAPLSPELQQAIDARPDGPVRLVDERTHTEYVLLSAAEYERLRESPDGSEDMYSLLAEIDPEDWEDASAYGAQS